MGRTIGVSRTVLDDICHRLKSLEIAVHRLQMKKRNYIPIYDKGRLPYSVHTGLLFFTDDTKQFGLKIDDQIYYADTEETQL